MGDKVRAHVIVSGRVQGVFFRAETRRAAQDNDVFGWVRNTNDGKVEAVFEGDEVDVNAMIEWCREGSSHSRVKNVNVEWDMYSGNFNEFEITY